MTAPLSEPSQRITGAETDAEKATVDKIEVEATETLVVEQVEEHGIHGINLVWRADLANSKCQSHLMHSKRNSPIRGSLYSRLVL